MSSCTSAISNASRFLQQGVLKKKKKLICTQGRRKLKGVENGCSRKNRFIGPPSPQEGFKEEGKRNDLFYGYDHISLYSKKQKENLLCTQGRRKLEGVESGCSRKKRFTGAPRPPQEGFKEEGESREFRRLEAYVGAYLICTEKKQKENLFFSDTKSNCWQRSLHRLKEHVLRILHQAGHRERERGFCILLLQVLLSLCYGAAQLGSECFPVICRFSHTAGQENCCIMQRNFLFWAGRSKTKCCSIFFDSSRELRNQRL